MMRKVATSRVLYHCVLSAFGFFMVLHHAYGSGRGVLQLDGIIVVRGDRASFARVVVLPTGAPPSVMERLSGRFSLDLALDATYLLSFEGEGMVTKQIYFDTSVPVDLHAATMTFPFKVTLFQEGKDGVYAYAGPVGVVRYDPARKDFGYETDYTLKPGALMTERLRILQERMDDRGEDGLPRDRTTTGYVATVGGYRTALQENEEAGPSPAFAKHGRYEGDARDRAGAPRPIGNASPVVTASEHAASTAQDHDEVLAAGYVPMAGISRTPVEEELLVERNRVITIVRVPGPLAHVYEYRRVVDRAGVVVHFQDGIQIPEHLYRERTGR